MPLVRRLYWSTVTAHPMTEVPMITATADAPAWLRRSDQAVSWARAMLQPDRAVVIDCETTDLPGAVCEVAVVDTCGRILLNSLVNPDSQFR